MCSRPRAVGVTVWGSDTCAADAALAYSGYAMSSVSERGGVQCVEKQQPRVARSTCEPKLACPRDGSSMTLFTFDKNSNPMNDFMYHVSGHVENLRETGAAGYTWGWAERWPSTGNKKRGVMYNTHDANHGGISTNCVFDSKQISLRMDVLCRMHTNPCVPPTSLSVCLHE